MLLRHQIVTASSTCIPSEAALTTQGLLLLLLGNLSSWKLLVDSPTPHTEALPEPWGQRLDNFQRLVLLRALRQDKLLPAVTNYVAEMMGRYGLASMAALGHRL